MSKYLVHIIGISGIVGILTGCELFTFGSKRAPVIEVSQKSSIGAVLLFKAELDSNNTAAATEILAGKDGSKLLALEKYEMSDEIARISRIITRKPITRMKTDTLAPDSHRIHLELDYLKNITFSTARINSQWYITAISE